MLTVTPRSRRWECPIHLMARRAVAHDGIDDVAAIAGGEDEGGEAIVDEAFEVSVHDESLPVSRVVAL